jgi:hypothetical protein
MSDETHIIRVPRTDTSHEVVPEFDIIFVHGLNGDARATWQSAAPGPRWGWLTRLWGKIMRTSRPPVHQPEFWLEWVAQEFPAAAVWSLGYPAASSAWRGHATPLPDRAKDILNFLYLRKFGNRPILFVAHSLGGLLVKQVLRTANTMNDTRWRSVSSQVKGILFLATPHSGAFLAAVLEVFRVAYRTRYTINDLQPHEPHLRELNLWFRQSYSSLKLHCHVLCETKKTFVAMVVDATTADPGITGISVDPVDKDHITICKPVDKGDTVFLHLKAFVCRAAPQAGLRSLQPGILNSYRKQLIETVRGPGTADLRLNRYVYPRLKLQRKGESEEDVPGSGIEAAKNAVRQLMEERRLVLHHDAGMGKTAFTFKCIELLSDPQASSDMGLKEPPLVVRIEGNWPRSDTDENSPFKSILQMIADVICDVLGSSVADRSAVETEVRTALRQESVVVLVDAFDQMTKAGQLHVADLLRQRNAGERHPEDVKGCRWLLTSRDYALQPRVEFSDWSRLRLVGLNEAEQDSYFSDFEDQPVFRQSGKKPLDWFCESRRDLADDLQLPLNLRLVRRLFESSLTAGELNVQQLQRQRISSTSQLQWKVSDTLLRRDLERWLLAQRGFWTTDAKAADGLALLKHICGVIALQMLLDGDKLNARVTSLEHGRNGVAELLQRSKARFLGGAGLRGTSPQAALAEWEWAIRFLEAIEVSYRGDIDVFSAACRSFRDRKTMEWYAAYYLVNHATEADRLGPPPRDAEHTLWERAHEDWMLNFWRQAIEMQAQAVNRPLQTLALELLFRQSDKRRPTGLIYRAWGVLEQDSMGKKVLETFLAEYPQRRNHSQPLQQMERGFVQCPPSGAAEDCQFTFGRWAGAIPVTVLPFLMQRAPVTVAQFSEFDSAYAQVEHSSLTKYSPKPDCPAIQINWYDAWCFARWCGGRLPREYEWEFACRAGTTSDFWWGDEDDPSKRTFNARTTTPASESHANRWGLMEMAGNVWGWCDDWYDDDLQTTIEQGFTGTSRVLRGGSFNYDYPDDLRCAYRSSSSPDYRLYVYGFRISRTK